MQHLGFRSKIPTLVLVRLLVPSSLGFLRPTVLALAAACGPSALRVPSRSLSALRRSGATRAAPWPTPQTTRTLRWWERRGSTPPGTHPTLATALRILLANRWNVFGPAAAHVTWEIAPGRLADGSVVEVWRADEKVRRTRRKMSQPKPPKTCEQSR